ncbi:MAG: K(+)-transporting ATPase subunit F [Verrucomicrobia bacterium]|nr:K(+)-transporting ATPase subunit F [Verrucomicrobiota bacterium]MBU6447136.1 K(+)-transporting ATPase subunit F [Verrucomicrobiota bacterium]MDE3047509.1 K(+)-transporting ATPase subunit F [Verrucomicrobiota bacterium]
MFEFQIVLLLLSFCLLGYLLVSVIWPEKF